MANTHIPQLSQEDAAALPIKWVIKAKSNESSSEYEARLHQHLEDGSIGINFGHYQELPSNVTDEHIVEAERQMVEVEQMETSNKKLSRNMLSCFRNDIKSGDYFIIGQGATGCRYVAQIESGYYYQPRPEDKGWAMHRRRMCNVRRLPEGFTRKYFKPTLGRYNPL